MSAWKFLSVIKGVQCLEAADGVGAAREAKTWRLSAARRRSFTVPVAMRMAFVPVLHDAARPVVDRPAPAGARRSVPGDEWQALIRFRWPGDQRCLGISG
jgi:hypothetical protein